MPDEIEEIKMVTIEGVEVASTGYWKFSTGPRWLTQEHLAAAVEAQEDPALKTPVIKIGHTDPRFDGNPLFGSIVNLRLDDNGQTLVGDFVIAASLAPLVAKAPDQEGDVPYPDRSIEGEFDIKSGSGTEHEFVLKAVSLLGEQAPAIEDLADILGVFTEDGDFVAAASSGKPEHGSQLLLAGTVVDKIRLGVWDEIPADDQPWGDWSWVRHLEIDSGSKGYVIVEDDDTAQLYRVPWEVKGDEITYGEASEVVEQYVAASAAPHRNSIGFTREIPKVRGNAVTLSGSKGTPPQETQVDLAKLRTKLGLAEDADEEAIEAKLDELAKAKEEPTPPTNEPPKPENEPETEPEKEEEGSEGLAAKLPEGVVAIDKDQLEELKANAADGAAARKQQQRDERDGFLAAAMQAGKFPKSRKEHYEKLFDKDPKGTREFIDSLAAGMVPVEEVGHPGGEDTTDDDSRYKRYLSLVGEGEG